MINIDFRLLEFLDSLPMAGCLVDLTVLVAPVFEVERIVPPREGEVRLPGPPESEVIEEPNLDMASRHNFQAVSNADGHALLSLNLESAFAFAKQKSDGDSLAIGAVAIFGVNVDVAGMRLVSRRAILEIAKADGDLSRTIIIDAAKSIVGHTTQDTSLLWFQFHRSVRAGQQFFCEVTDSLGQFRERHPIVPSPSHFDTATLQLSGLTAGETYKYQLCADTATLPAIVLTQGRFRTIANANRLSIAFGSCHLPTNENAMSRWKILAERDDFDLLMLIGDQIYGDGIDNIFPNDSWRDRYAKRYNQLWAYQPLRNAIRKRPVYMMLDDHEVSDDWGTEDLPPERIAAGLEVYRIFQQAHNPGGRDAPNIDYEFRQGPVAFFSLDGRTARGSDPEFPILGRRQFQRFQAWANAPATRNADVICLVSPVPLAMLPLPDLQILADRLAQTGGAVSGSLIGALAGAIIAGVLTGGLGAAGGAVVGGFIGGMVGALGAEIAYEHFEASVKDPDVRDAWNFGLNTLDLTRTLDVLFDLANDIQPDGSKGPRPRAVLVLAGDYHFGAIHRVDSNRTGDGHDHRTNPHLLQITSSPISHDPVGDDHVITFEDILSRVEEGGRFNLDSGTYSAEFLARTMGRNFGRAVIERIGTGRKYRFQLYDESESESIMQLVEFDLDARPVTMRDLLGEVVGARGKITLLRTHDIGTGFGPVADAMDVEVVIELDAEPGRAFGFQLRPGPQLPAHRAMLTLMRSAFRHARPIQIDYLRTGLKNGTIIRATEF